MIKYHISSRIIHWFMALIILAALSIGLYMEEFLPKDAQNRMEIFNLHKSLGVMALIFIVIRLLNRLIHPAPAMPEGLPKIEKFGAHFVHILLYILMIFVPLSGYLMSNSFGYPVYLFSLEMPSLIGANPQIAEFFAEAHEILAYTLIAAIIVHFLGAVKHRFFDKPENDVLKRML